MDIDLRTLAVEQVYAHFVPLRLSGAQPKYSSKPSNLTGGTRDRIENNVRVSLAKQQLRLFVQEPSATSGYQLIHDLLHAKKGTLKTVSQSLSRYLWSIQPGSSSSGMLLVAQARCNNLPAIALMKVDSEPRVTQSERDEDGEITFDLSEIQTLNMDSKSVFKAALFVATEDEDGTLFLEIIASDNQANGSDGRNAADFFVKTFLGCVMVDNPGEMLKRAADTFMDYVSDNISDPIVKCDMVSDILAKLGNSDPTFDIDQVMSDCVPEEDRAALTEKLKKNGVVAVEMEKDTSQLDDAKFMAFTLDNGLRILGPRDKIFDMVDTEESVGGLQHLRIEGKIIDVKLRKRL